MQTRIAIAWANVTRFVIVVGGQNQLSLSSFTSTCFFQLVHPRDTTRSYRFEIQQTKNAP